MRKSEGECTPDFLSDELLMIPEVFLARVGFSTGSLAYSDWLHPIVMSYEVIKQMIKTEGIIPPKKNQTFNTIAYLMFVIRMIFKKL